MIVAEWRLERYILLKIERLRKLWKILESAVKMREDGKSREQTVNILCYSVCIGNGSGG